MDRFADDLLRESAATREWSCRLRAQSQVLHRKSRLLMEQAEALYLGIDMGGKGISTAKPRDRR